MKIERLQGLEPYEGKLSRTVLRQEKLSNQFYLAAKKLFGSEENTDILISFINSILSEDQQIKEIILKNPYNIANYKKDKMSILDIKAVDEAVKKAVERLDVMYLDKEEREMYENELKRLRDYIAEMKTAEETLNGKLY